MKEWDGTERRQEMQTLVTNLGVLNERLGNLILTFEKHVESTEKRFSNLEGKVWMHTRYIYIGIGVVGVIEMLFGLHK